FVRGILFAIAVTLVWWMLNRFHKTSTPFINGIGGVTVAISSALTIVMFLTAVNRTTAANLVFILALNPVFCAVFAWLFLREKMHRWTWAAIFLAFAGVGVIVWDGLKAGTYVGDILAVGVAMCMAIALTVVRKTGKNLITSLAI